MNEDTNIRIAKLYIEGQEIINTQISTYKTKWINYCLFFYFSPLAFVSLN